MTFQSTFLCFLHMAAGICHIGLQGIGGGGCGGCGGGGYGGDGG